MKTPFLEYYKMILDKVSFDHQLMMKEYHKAKTFLKEPELNDLNSWLASRGLQSIAPNIPMERKSSSVGRLLGRHC